MTDDSGERKREAIGSRASAPTEATARGSLARDQVPHRRSDSREPCTLSRHRLANKLSFTAIRNCRSSYSFLLISAKRNWILSTHRHIGVERARHWICDTWLCARKLELENVTYSLKEREGEVEERKIRRRSGDRSPSYIRASSSSFGDESPSFLCALCQRRNRSSRRLALPRSVSDILGPLAFYEYLTR